MNMATPNFNANLSSEDSRLSDFSFGLPVSDTTAPYEPTPGETEPQLKPRRPRKTSAGDVIVAFVILGAALVSILGVNRQTIIHNFPQVAAVLRLTAAAQKPALPAGADAQIKVWADRNTGLYYCPGADSYGRTRNGRYMSQAEARLESFEPAQRRDCTTPAGAVVAER
jgi:hypothetical protein